MPTIVDISNIDKSNPEVSASCTATSASVRINVTASDEISGLHETAYSYNNGAWTSQSYFDVQNQDTVSIRVRDLAGNIETLSYTPDPLCPTEVVVNPSSGWTNGDVTITVNGTGLSKYKYGSNNWVTSNTYLVSQNGSVSISVEDANNKQKALNDVTISNIDKDLPIISNVTVSESTWTNNPVTVTVNASDAPSGIASYSFDGGASWQASNSKTFSETNDSIVVKQHIRRLSKSLPLTQLHRKHLLSMPKTVQYIFRTKTSTLTKLPTVPNILNTKSVTVAHGLPMKNRLRLSIHMT